MWRKPNWPSSSQDRSISMKHRRCLCEEMTSHFRCLHRLVFRHNRKLPPNSSAPKRTSDAHVQWTEVEEDSKPVQRTTKVEWRTKDEGHDRRTSAAERTSPESGDPVGDGVQLVSRGRSELESVCVEEETQADDYCTQQTKDHCRSTWRQKEPKVGQQHSSRYMYSLGNTLWNGKYSNVQQNSCSETTRRIFRARVNVSLTCIVDNSTLHKWMHAKVLV